jgi:hypothetical protein
VSAVPSKLAERIDEVRNLVNLAETYAADGAAMSVMQTSSTRSQ